MNLRRLFTAALLTAMPLALAAQHPTLLVLSKQDQTLALVDPSSLKVLARVPVGEDPHEVIASSDGRIAWASNYGFGALHTLAVVDLVHARALPAIDLGPLRGPHGLDFVGNELWFTCEGAKALGRLNPATGKPDLVLGTGQNRTHMLIVSPDQQHVIAANVASGTISFLDAVPFNVPPAAKGSHGPMPTTDWNQTVVPVGPGSEGFDLSPDGREVWVADAGNGNISILDRNAHKVIATLPAGVTTANRLKFTRDGRFVLVTCLKQPDVLVFDAQTRQLVHRIPVGHGAAGLLMSPDGQRAFASCSPDNYVAVIDLASFKVVGHIDAGGNPDGLAWTVRP